MNRLPRVFQTLMETQMLDITASPIEIAPTAHYSMGGVWVDPVDHSTDVEGLWAIGEASSGLHGANRLGGNSLIELLVFGRIVGRSAVAYSDGLEAQVRSHAAVDEARAEISALLASEGTENVRALQREVRNLMTEHAGVVRDEAGLLAGLEKLGSVEARMKDVGTPGHAGFAAFPHAFDRGLGACRPGHARVCVERRDPRLPQPQRLSGDGSGNACQSGLVIVHRVVREPIPRFRRRRSFLHTGEISQEGKLVE